MPALEKDSMASTKAGTALFITLVRTHLCVVHSKGCMLVVVRRSVNSVDDHLDRQIHSSFLY